MNILTSNSAAAVGLAHRTVSDTVPGAETRTEARALRAQRRADPQRRGTATAPTTPRTWVRWFARLAH